MRAASELDAIDDDDDDDLVNKVSNPGSRNEEEYNRTAVDKQECSGDPRDADSQTSSSVRNLIVNQKRKLSITSATGKQQNILC